MGYPTGEVSMARCDAPVRAIPTLGALAEKVEQLSGRIARASVKAGELGDRLGGSRPSPISKDQGADTPSPLLIRLDRGLDEAFRMCDLLDGHLDRVDTAL